MKKILVLTSSYQRSINDHEYRNFFVPSLTRGISESCKVYVIAPSDKKTKKHEEIDDIQVFRFKQGLFRRSGFAYGSGILPNIKKNKFLLLTAPFFMLNQFLLVRKVCKKMDIDVIHAHWVVPQGIVAAIYKKYFNKKLSLIITCPGADILEDDHSFSSITKNKLICFALKQADEVVTISQENMKAINKCGYKEKIHIIPYGIDTDFFHPSKRDDSLKLKYNITGMFALYVGNIIERKGVKFIVEAAPAVIKKYPDFIFVFLGMGNEMDNMKSLSMDLGINENLLFLGYVTEDEKAAFMASADMFVFPSLSEGFGLVNIEAMSSKTIPIVSDIPVFREIIKDGITGIITEKENPKELARAIVEFINSSDKHKEMEEKAREEVVEKYDWKVIVLEYIKLMESI
ncbi:MAG: glycosyltransferase family 4 protein [Oscillospiraceae bacterium]|nr:glycosyltransferase family 4 protein [Oscillospiraceae bacterium]